MLPSMSSSDSQRRPGRSFSMGMRNASPLAAVLIACLTSLFVQSAQAQDLFNKVDQPCNTSNSQLLIASNQLMTDCGYVAWCNPANNICSPRGCRIDEYPFGYSTMERSKWPHQCPSTQFCPDEGSMCMDKIAIGGDCQLNRDDQCQGAESRCLFNKCTAVDAKQGAACIHENVVYTTFTPDNSSYGNIVSRDNCEDGLYCDSATSVCQTRLPKGAPCASDKQCITNFCQDNGYTSSTPDNNDLAGKCFDHPYISSAAHQGWIYPVIIIIVVIPMLLIILILLKLHVKQGAERRKKARQYWESQRALTEKARLFRDDLFRNSVSGTPLLSSSSEKSKLRSELSVDGQLTPGLANNRRRSSAQQYGQAKQRLSEIAAYSSETSLLTAPDPAAAAQEDAQNSRGGGAESPVSHRMSMNTSITNSPPGRTASIHGSGPFGQRHNDMPGFTEVPMEYNLPQGTQNGR